MRPLKRSNGTRHQVIRAVMINAATTAPAAIRASLVISHRRRVML
jgi:hypothetical protein